MLLFAEVVATGGITAAAERLGLRKSTVSRRLAALEERLGIEEYRIRSMPTLLFFKQGKVVKQIIGAVPRAKLEEALRPLIGG